MQIEYGRLNGHLIGFVMKEMVRRAIEAIRKERFGFVAHAKEGYAGEMNDVLTSADLAAQKVYVKMIREAFPTYGVIAEEDELRVECTDKAFGDFYFTVDPLDGTKAFSRRQSHGVGTMIALVHNDRVIAAYVGDVMTREIYGFRPDSNRVHRISEYDHGVELSADTLRPLREQYALLRGRIESHTPIIRAMLALPQHDGACKDIEITGGSIGISMARLWKGEVGLAVLEPSYETPWDSTPVIGISRKLGYVFLTAGAGDRLEPLEMRLPKAVTYRDAECVVVHDRHLPELLDWQQRRGT